MSDVDCKLTVLVAGCTLCGFCLLPLIPPPTLPLYLFFLWASRLSYSFSAAKVKCCLLPVRSEGAQGYSGAAPPPPPSPRFVATMLLAASSPALPPASGGGGGGGGGSRPGCRGMCLSPVVSSLLSCSRLLKLDLFSTHHTERGPTVLQDSSGDQFTMFTVTRNDK